MAKITVTRTDKEMPVNMDAARDFLFGVLDGANKEDKRAWRRFWKKTTSMEPGECAVVEMRFPRNQRFHRKFFALLELGFESWEPKRKRKQYKGMAVEKNFEQFREDVTILAGFYEQTFNLRGEMKLKAKSISFANMDDVEFEHVYSAVADVLLREVLLNYAGRDALDAVVNKIIGFF